MLEAKYARAHSKGQLVKEERYGKCSRAYGATAKNAFRNFFFFTCLVRGKIKTLREIKVERPKILRHSFNDLSTATTISLVRQKWQRENTICFFLTRSFLFNTHGGLNRFFIFHSLGSNKLKDKK